MKNFKKNLSFHQLIFRFLAEIMTKIGKDHFIQQEKVNIKDQIVNWKAFDWFYFNSIMWILLCVLWFTDCWWVWHKIPALFICIFMCIKCIGVSSFYFYESLWVIELFFYFCICDMAIHLLLYKKKIHVSIQCNLLFLTYSLYQLFTWPK